MMEQEWILSPNGHPDANFGFHWIPGDEKINVGTVDEGSHYAEIFVDRLKLKEFLKHVLTALEES